VTPVTLRYNHDQPPPKERDGTLKERDGKRCHVPQKQYPPPPTIRLYAACQQQDPAQPAENKHKHNPSKTRLSAALQQQDPAQPTETRQPWLNTAQPVKKSHARPLNKNEVIITTTNFQR